MGAVAFSTFGSGTTIAQVFKDLREEAQYERGHGGYTGTIAEKRGYVIIGREPQSLDAARDMAYKLIDAEDPRIDDKWGPAGAIRVKDDSHDGWLFFGWASE